MSNQLTVTPTSLLEDISTPENDTPYNIFLWNDPITPMVVVTRALKKIFGYSTEKATAMMEAAHNDGKAVVYTGEKNKAESYCVKLHAAGLQATIAKDA